MDCIAVVGGRKRNITIMADGHIVVSIDTAVSGGGVTGERNIAIMADGHIVGSIDSAAVAVGG